MVGVVGSSPIAPTNNALREAAVNAALPAALPLTFERSFDHAPAILDVLMSDVFHSRETERD